MKTIVLDHGYVMPIETWGSDQRIIEAARMSTSKGFNGWGPKCRTCGDLMSAEPRDCPTPSGQTPFVDCGRGGHMFTDPGDEKLLRFLWENKHATPFEMAGATFEIQAPIFVFREWHRHRTQCLAPDTLIHFEAPKSHDGRRFVYKMRIEDVWRKWQPTQRASRPERQINAMFSRTRIQAMRLRCLDENAGEFIDTRIVDVIRGEPKPMLTVTTSSGRSFTATRDHKVLTNEGWACLGDALGNKSLLTLEGTTRAKAARWEVPLPKQHQEWRPVVGWEDIYQISNHGQVRRVGCEPKRSTVNAQGYDVVSLNRPGRQETRTVHRLVLEAFEGRSDGSETRHLDSNRANNAAENLMWGSTAENAVDRTDADRQQRLVPVHEEVVWVREAGEFPTFDLAVAAPWHNVVADGFVVHNSYNEMSARYTPLPDVNYIPSVERLMLGSDGKNKQAGTVTGAAALDLAGAEMFRAFLRASYAHAEEGYQEALRSGVPKELARIHLPVGRYSRMRASANLRNWLGFLTLRSTAKNPAAQWEIRQFADAVHASLAKNFPRTMALFDGRSDGNG